MSTALQKVKAIKDQDGHWYVIPDNLESTFIEMESCGEADEWEAFNEMFSQYRTGGDLNLVQLYAEM